MEEISKQIHQFGIVPVVKIDRPADALPLVQALAAGGLPLAEITFRTEAAEEAIRLVAQQLPDVLLGAGTVLTTQQVDRALAAGARFIVSPGLNPDLVCYCQQRGVAVFPGCSSPSDIEQALTLGLQVVKFFPAEVAGGLAMIRALSGPYGMMRFIPTGGISEANLGDYLDHPQVLACGGTWMVQDALVKTGRFDEVERLTCAAVAKMLGFRLDHIGINYTEEAAARQDTQALAALFALPQQELENSFFAGAGLELMKRPGRGANGHIAIATRSLDRAYAYLTARGHRFVEDSKKYDAKGRLRFIYLEEEFGGFAIHLVNG